MTTITATAAQLAALPASMPSVNVVYYVPLVGGKMSRASLWGGPDEVLNVVFVVGSEPTLAAAQTAFAAAVFFDVTAIN